MKNHLILGDWNALCDSCGRKFKASSLQKRWDGLIVCKEDWEQRHPQDLLRVQREQISVPWARPYPAEDTYLPWNYTDTEKENLSINEAIAKNILKRFGYTNDSSALGNFVLNTAALNFNGVSPVSTERFTFSETLLVSLARFLTDNLSLAETFAKSTTKRISETISIAESLYFVEQEHSVDTLSLAESRTSLVIKRFSESLPITETFVKTTTRLLTDTVAITETYANAPTKKPTDSLSLAETSRFTFNKNTTDSLSITESTSYKFSTATALNGAALDTKLLG
jgi:hypothetical protein